MIFFLTKHKTNVLFTNMYIKVKLNIKSGINYSLRSEMIIPCTNGRELQKEMRNRATKFTLVHPVGL